MYAQVKAEDIENEITITLSHSLDTALYDLPLTLKTYVSPKWKTITVKQNGHSQPAKIATDVKGTFILYQASPNKGFITISGK